MVKEHLVIKKFSLRFFWLNLRTENLPIIALHLLTFVIAGFFVSWWLTGVLLLQDFANSWHLTKIYQTMRENNDLPF
jgi:hypothetical protein